ncbi:VWA domain-containing protein [Pontibacter sp. G13]|uniref:VWA domain-containing protein n=1 Tax=Pontibacter sp. G13 TaxID=3074898 RepID=UPI00288C1E43|nr:VWA domain-containing protein [Pontibacter sp. G13]WNJ16752.1 VWA domain-containing protein [Pontibacter sp. G13]
MKLRYPFILTILAICGPIWLFGQQEAPILDHQGKITLQRLDILNSSSRETNLSISPDGSTLFFMSLRGLQPWSQLSMIFDGDSVYDGDIWMAERIGDKWRRPICLPSGINTPAGEDEPNISPNGNTIYYQSWYYGWDLNGGPYYQAQRSGREWGVRRGMGGGITEFFKTLPATDGMSISYDESKFLVAAGPDYDANMDIYLSQKISGIWSYCRRLPFNTPADERSVFIAGDGKTIYFASEGYGGFGGLDIFKTTLNPDGTTGPVVNLGEPFNSSRDDYGLILTANGEEAYFIRDGDIFYANLKDADPEARPAPVEATLALVGSIRDSLTWKGLAAEMILFDARTKRVIKKIATNASGRYSVELANRDQIIDQVIIVEGYRKVRKRISIEKVYADDQVTSNILIGPVRPDAPAEPIAEAEPIPTEEPTSSPTEITETTDDPIEEPIVQAEPTPTAIPKPQPLDYSFDAVAENNLILLLDVSASMRKPDRLPLLQKSLSKLLGHMRQEDQISVIAFSGNAKVVVDGRSAHYSEEIMKKIKELKASGQTKSKNALKRAYKLAEDHFIQGGNNRIIIATDGSFDVEALYTIASKYSNKQIQLSVFTFGKVAPKRQEELSRLAQSGGGNCIFIEPENIDYALLEEVKAVKR